MTRQIATNLTGDHIKAIIDVEQAKYEAVGNTEAYMALARVLRVIAAHEVDEAMARGNARRTRKTSASVVKANTNVWPPKDC